MSSFLNQSQISSLTGIFSNHFDTFSSGSNNYITVVKTPVQTINNVNSNVLPGYGSDNLNVTDITYQPPVTGVFPAIIIYPHTLQSTQFGQLKFSIDSNQVMVKVKEDCKNFIVNNKTERIFIDNQTYNNELTYSIQSYFGSKYYYFRLTSTR